MERSVSLRIGDRGRVVIPAGLRAAAGVTEGQELVAHADGEGRIVLETRESIKTRLRGQAAASTSRKGGVVDRLLADRRADLGLERRRARSRRTRAQSRS